MTESNAAFEGSLREESNLEVSANAKAAARTKSSSRTRDHLANERTYLAWMRTAIALIGFGVLIARLRYLISPDVPGTGYGWALGMMLACIGLLTVLLSTWHYFSVQRAIDSDTYEPSSRWILLFSLVVTLMGTGVLYVLFSVPSTVKGDLLF
jgi:putative membrane protein